MDHGTTTDGTSPGADLRTALRTELRIAMKARDRPAVSACRSALAAIDNAEAVPVGQEQTPVALEASPVGVGATEVARRVLGQDAILAVVQAEVQELWSAAAEVEGFDPDRAEELRRGAKVLTRHLP